jgi:hypothetical protein
MGTWPAPRHHRRRAAGSLLVTAPALAALLLGGTPAVTTPALLATAATTTTVRTVKPVRDTMVVQTQRRRSYGHATDLLLSRRARGLVSFSTPSLPSGVRVAAAHLCVTPTTTSRATVVAFRVKGAWSNRTTWATRPRTSGAAVASLSGSFRRGHQVCTTVRASTVDGRSTALVLLAKKGGIRIGSRENHPRAAQLRLTLAGSSRPATAGTSGAAPGSPTAPSTAPPSTAGATAGTFSAGLPLGLATRASVWKWPVSAAPLASNSAQQVANVVREVKAHYGGHAGFNIYSYGMSWYNASATQRRTTVLFSNCQKKKSTPPGLYGTGGQFESVPIPDGAIPTVGTDSALSVYQASTDTLWDFWRAYHDARGWHACWGGRIDHYAADLGRFPGFYGASASGLAKEAGIVSINDVESGHIDHAVSLSLTGPIISKVRSWPALRSDGISTVGNALAEGQRLRLDPRLDVDKLGLNPIARMIAIAGQKYGFIISDKAGCVAVAGESPAAVEQATGKDPWKRLLGGLRPSQVLTRFPWGSLQALPVDYGKP